MISLAQIIKTTHLEQPIHQVEPAKYIDDGNRESQTNAEDKRRKRRKRKERKKKRSHLHHSLITKSYHYHHCYYYYRRDSLRAVLPPAPYVAGCGDGPRSCPPSFPGRGCRACPGNHGTGYGGDIGISVCWGGWRRSWPRDAWIRCRRQCNALCLQRNHWHMCVVVARGLMRAN